MISELDLEFWQPAEFLPLDDFTTTSEPLFPEFPDEYFQEKQKDNQSQIDQSMVDQEIETVFAAAIQQPEKRTTAPVKKKPPASRNPSDYTLSPLPASKTPIIDAFIYCALKNLGVSLINNEGVDIRFQVTDIKFCMDCSEAVTGKEHTTSNLVSRVKTLRRWFTGFPRKRVYNDRTMDFTISLKKANQATVKKIRGSISAMQRVIDNE